MSKPWADTPYTLLPIPGTPGAPSCNNPGVMHVAIEMANVHNTFLRGLNSIYLQTPHVTEAADISDLLLFVKAWADGVHHHHSLEERILFPAYAALAKEVGLPEGVMDANLSQHEVFEPKIEETLDWAQDVRDGKKEYDQKTLMGLIDGFAGVLTEHLHDEIKTLMKLEGCDGEEVKKAMKQTAEEGIKTADTSLVIPMVYGCADKTFPGGEDFPPAPFFLPYLNAYWFTRKHQGCWRFNPCDHWGQPRPLQFL